jgi:hypothetical protein
MSVNARRDVLAVTPILLLAWLLLTINLGGAWVGHQDNNGAWISASVLNFQRHGFLTLKGLPTVDTTLTLANPPLFYTSHPPIAVWMPTALVSLTGYHEAVMRFLFAALTLLGAAVLYCLAHALRGAAFARWTLLFYAAMPMTAFFGRMPDHEAPALLWLLLFALSLTAFIKHGRRRQLALLALLCAVQAWTAWGGLIGVWVLCAAGMLLDRQRAPALIGVALIGGTAAAAVLVYYQSAWPGTFDELLWKLSWRTSAQSGLAGSASFSGAEFLVRLAMRFVTLCTPMIAVLSLIGVLRAQPEGGDGGAGRLARALPLALIVGGLAFVLVFRNASYIHDYYLIYVTPGVALLAAGAMHITAGMWGARWLRPLVLALTLMIPLGTVHYLRQLHSGGADVKPLEVADGLARHTQPDDTIYASTPYVGMAIELYAARVVHYEIPPDQARRSATSIPGRVYYLMCGEPDAALRALAVQIPVTEGCTLFRLR